MKLELPPAYRTIHPVFHVSLLEPAPEDRIPGRRQLPPPPVVVQDELEWEVKAILDAKLINRKLHYLVTWAGYEDDPFEKDNWQPARNLESSKDLVAEYHSLHPDKPLKDLPPTSRRNRPRKFEHLLEGPEAPEHEALDSRTRTYFFIEV
jgi:hypothetical protein